MPSRRPRSRTPSARPSGHVRAGDYGSASKSKKVDAVRSETKKPFTFSAGHVAHQPTTPTVTPFADARFQIAGTLRDRPEIGSFARVFGSSSSKSSTPWSTGVRPVATVVQMRGEDIGWYVSKFQVRPRATSAARFGRRPSFKSGSSSFQSAPSQPTRTTRGLEAADGLGLPGKGSAAASSVTAAETMSLRGRGEG